MRPFERKDLLWRGGEERIERRVEREGRGREKKRDREREPRHTGTFRELQCVTCESI